MVIFLETAELRAKRQTVTTMSFWRENIDQIIAGNGFPLLAGAGSVSRAQMEQHIAPLFQDYDQRRKTEEAQAADERDESELKGVGKQDQGPHKDKIVSGQTKVHRYKTLRPLVSRLRDDFKGGGNDFVLLFAYNVTGKTRLFMAFKDAGKSKEGVARDALYFNAYTEDLFHWDNDLEKRRWMTISPPAKNYAGRLRSLTLASSC